MRWSLIFAMLALPTGAYASGSSVVRADSEFFSVSIESVRKIFSRGEGESEWHDNWKREHRGEVQKLKRRLEAKFDRNPFPIIEYKKSYPEVREHSVDDEENASIVKKPFCIRFEFDRARVSLAFARKPPRAVRNQIKRALGDILR